MRYIKPTWQLIWGWIHKGELASPYKALVPHAPWPSPSHNPLCPCICGEEGGDAWREESFGVEMWMEDLFGGRKLEYFKIEGREGYWFKVDELWRMVLQECWFKEEWLIDQDHFNVIQKNSFFK